MYRCYLLDQDGRVQEVREVACATDAEAELAARELRDPAVAQVEVWQSVRLLRRLIRPPPSGPEGTTAG